jgi:hypothetical protein
MYHFLITQLAGIASIFFVYTRVYLSSIGFTKPPNRSVCHQHTQVFSLVLERGVVLSTIWQTSNQTMHCIHSQPETCHRCPDVKDTYPHSFQVIFSGQEKMKGRVKLPQPKHNATKLYMKFTVKVTYILRLSNMYLQMVSFVLCLLYFCSLRYCLRARLDSVAKGRLLKHLQESLLYCSNSCTSLHFKILKYHTKTLKIHPYMFWSPLKPSSGGP